MARAGRDELRARRGGDGTLWLALVRAGLAAAMFAFVLTFRPVLGRPEPSYVQPAALTLACMPLLLAMAQLVPRLRASRRMAASSFAVDALAVLAMLALYAFDLPRTALALVVVVQVEGGLLLGLPGGLGAWAATTIASIGVQALAASRSGEPISVGALALSAAVGLALAIGAGALSEELSGERARRLADHQAELESVRAQEERYRKLVEATPAVTYVRVPDRSGSTAYMSPQIMAMLGIEPQEWIDDPDLWPARMHPDDRARIVAESDRANATGQPFVQEYRLLARDGHVVWVRDEAVPIRADDGSVLSWQGVMMDVTERKRVEEQVSFLAYHDPLTGLPNRLLFEESLDTAMGRARRHASAVAVLYMDLDDFKTVNDTLGHDAGDEFLREVADRLRGAVRDADLVARQGGDEFLVLLADLAGGNGADEVPVAESAARAIAARIREALEPPIVTVGLPFVPSASIGIALFPGSAGFTQDGRGLLLEADAAMYRSKRSGPGGVALSAGFGAWPVSRVSLASRLRRAAETQAWAVHYQPVIDLKTGRVVGVEALVRWRDEEGRLVPPAGFLRMAEDAGLVDAIDDWVLGAVVEQMTAWSAEGVRPGFCSVNVSVERCRRTDLAPRMLERVRGAGVDPTTVMVEVADSTPLAERGTQRTLEGLRDGGFRIAVDDFGTGSSSLAMLREVGIDVLKMDRPFLRGVPSDPQAARVLGAMIGLARSLGIEPMAEGVETEDQRAFLTGAGCRFGQGFLFSPPVPASDVPALMQRSRA